MGNEHNKKEQVGQEESFRIIVADMPGVLAGINKTLAGEDGGIMGEASFPKESNICGVRVFLDVPIEKYEGVLTGKYALSAEIVLKLPVNEHLIMALAGEVVPLKNGSGGIPISLNTRSFPTQDYKFGEGRTISIATEVDLGEIAAQGDEALVNACTAYLQVVEGIVNTINGKDAAPVKMPIHAPKLDETYLAEVPEGFWSKYATPDVWKVLQETYEPSLGDRDLPTYGGSVLTDTQLRTAGLMRRLWDLYFTVEQAAKALGKSEEEDVTDEELIAYLRKSFAESQKKNT